jgi:EpsI family protein
VLAGHFTEMQPPLVTQEHYSFGWYMFAGMMLLYFLVVRRWPEAPAAGASPPAATGVIAPTRAMVAALLALAVAPVWLLVDTNRASESQLSVAMRDDAAPRAAPGAAGDWRPNFPGASRELHGSFAEEGTTVEFYAAGYLSQHQGAELVGFGNSLLGEKLRRGPRGAAPAPWKEQQADGAGGRSVIWSAYRLDDRWYSSSLRVQLDYGLRSLWSAPAGAVIALRAPCTANDCDAARQTLKQLAETHYP